VKLDNNNGGILSVDASIYDPNYNKAFEKLAINLKHMGEEICHDTVRGVNYLLDNINTYQDVHTSKAQLLLENGPNYDNVNSETKIFSSYYNFNSLLYKTSVFFKASDSTVDIVRFSFEPTMEHARVVVRDYIHLQSIFQGSNIYSLSLSAIDVAHYLYQGEAKQAGIQAITTASYMLLPEIGSLVVPEYSEAVTFIYRTAMITYNGYSFANNVYSLYVNHGAVESKLKSDLAYSNLYIKLGWNDSAKELLEDVVKIVKDDIEMYPDSCTEVQNIAFEKYHLTEMMDYLGMECSYCNI